MTWMLRMRMSLVLAMLAIGCNSGPMGTGSSYPVPPARMGNPGGSPPIATQPAGPGMAASSVRVLPFATLPSYATMQGQNAGVRPLAVLAANNQMIDGRSMPFLTRSASTSQVASLANGFPAAPQETLKFRGGRTIRDLSWVNIYVGGQPAWDPQDWRNIDNTLAAAMSDEHLNNVVRQYFNNQPLKNSFKGSYFLAGWKPTSVSKVELERQLAGLHAGGAFNGMDLPNTVVNFMLPRGTVLGDPTAGMEGAPAANNGVPDSGTGDSTGGLGGYHGSVRAKNDETVYYAVGVYSERLPNGGSNGIPVFDQNWKNVVATFYHQLQEARTDPDVAEAVPGNGPNPSSWLGWTSDSGHEIGDYAITAAQPLSLAFREVPLADGSGHAPIQLLYSNAVQGPQGPIAYPNGMQPPPETKPPVTNPPVTNDPELDKLVASWNQLEDFVKKAIIRLANSK